MPNDVNAHPHNSMSGEFVLIHNGIIENYKKLKDELLENGYSFYSDTDTEILVNWIEFVHNTEGLSFEETIRKSLAKVMGTFGLVIISRSNPGKLIATRRGSPLVVGLGENEFFVASDATPIVEYTHRVMYLEDDDVVVLTKDALQLTNISKEYRKAPMFQNLDLSVDDIDKSGYEHFMLKEIFEQPHAISDTIRGRILPDGSDLKLGGVLDYMPQLVKAKRIIILACGTSWHSGLVGEYLFENYAKIPVEVDYASEFRYRNPIIFKDDIVIAISQSGETADTLAAIKMVRKEGATVLGICNVVGSSIARETHAGVYTHAGPEIGVASTKAFTTQVAVLSMMALLVGKMKGTISNDEYIKLVKELKNLPSKIEWILNQSDKIQEISKVFHQSSNALFLGRGYLFPIALEGALKLKEISYIHAEGYPAAEMKHGPIALIDQKMPVVFIAAKDTHYDKIVNNVQEVKARKGIVISLVTDGDTQIAEMSDYVINIPPCHEALTPIIAVIPLQLFAYYIAVMRGCNVDQPRNLAKSVTVE